MANTYQLIQAQTLSSTAATVTFSSIPATYKDLVVKVSARSNDAALLRTLTVAVNGSTSLSSFTYLSATGSTTQASNATNNNSVVLNDALTAANATANTFNNAEIYIPNYTSTGSKSITGTGVSEHNSTTGNGIVYVAGLYRTTVAINTIALSLNTSGTNQFIAGSSFYLYGIKNT